MKNFYQTIGVEKTASQDEIKAAYRQLAKDNHPDKNPGDPTAEARFKEINEAYETLKDPAKRQQYDAQMNGFGAGRQHGFYDSGPGYSHGFAGSMDIDEILNEIRRSRQGHMWQEPARNRDINIQYQITLEEAYSGKDAEIRYSLPDRDGKKITFKIPAGIQNGTKMRFAGGGDDSINNVPPGDLFIRIIIVPHHRFVRHGPNLATAVEIDYLDAMLGTEVEVVTIEGKTIKLRVPAGMVPGQSLRASGKGMPLGAGLGAEERGDLHIEVLITPAILNDEQRKLIEEARSKRNA